MCQADCKGEQFQARSLQSSSIESESFAESFIIFLLTTESPSKLRVHLAEHKKYLKENGVKDAKGSAEKPGKVRRGKSKLNRAAAETEATEAPAPGPKKRPRPAAKPAAKVKASRVK